MKIRTWIKYEESYLPQNMLYVSSIIDKINVNNVIGICNDIAESLSGSFLDVIIKKNEEVISTYQLGQGEMCTCKSVFINGVEV